MNAGRQLGRFRKGGMAMALWVGGLIAGALASPTAEAAVITQNCAATNMFCTLDELYGGASFEVDGLDFNDWFDPLFNPQLGDLDQGVALGIGDLQLLYYLDLSQIIVTPKVHDGGFLGFKLSGQVQNRVTDTPASSEANPTPLPEFTGGVESILEDIIFGTAFSVSSQLPSYKISAAGLEWGPNAIDSFALGSAYLPQPAPPFDPSGPQATSSPAAGIPGVTIAESAATTQLPEAQPELLAVIDVLLAFEETLDLNFGLDGDDPLDPAPGQSIPEPSSLALALAGLWALARRQRYLSASTASPQAIPLA